MSERRPLNWPDEIARSRNPEAVREMFDRVASRYDIANHLLSMGCDFWWRQRASEIVALWRPPCVLDVATGSGDLALCLKRKLPKSRITGVDFSPAMADMARSKGMRDVIVADALHLPFAPQSFDAVTVAFGLRNMRNWSAGLCEMRRVLTPSGHLLILDFSLPRNPILRRTYGFYLHQILPLLCRVITSEKEAYEYLGATIATFPDGREMCRLIESNGFSGATAEPLTAGIVTIYSAAASSTV